MHKLMGLKFLAGLGLAAGVGLMFYRMVEMRHEMLTEAARDPQAPGERRHFGHGHWHKRYPPIFDYWHQQAHAQDKAPAPEGDKPKPAAEAPQA